ncbi:30S ribosomal subunit protein S1 [Candidatus Xenohaliotis californiensis]|uniref:30S ribosomal subunit protein S1 n=1 Tax=Candidatus Xenohaliotis californiensis TaxID=84677 RepID=A0ABP0EX78_9RICK|nr:30S ribosomal subunit protein S1 [Candidatus Xenohaliotis californiensis]
MSYIYSNRRYNPSITELVAVDENFENLLDNSAFLKNRENNLIQGVIIGMDGKEAIVDIGMKVEGKIPISEFALGKQDSESIKIGDVVKVYLECIEGLDGMASLSREKALREEMWGKLEKIADNGDTIEGVIFGKVKCGFTVDIQGVVAFLPGSQVDVKIVKDMTSLMDKPQLFKILKMNKKQGNIVVSRRAILEESRNELRGKLLANISEGDIVDGVIKNITDYGAFIDLGGIDGLLHVTDIAWRRINHPSELLSIGQELKTKIIRFDKVKNRISLGLKQVEQNPWIGLSNKYLIGSRHEGIVTNLTDYGVFVELEDGIEGLVYISEISWLKFNNNPRDLLHKGQKVMIEVLSIDEEKNKISLSIKRCTDSPWVKFAENYKCGSIVEGAVRHITDFGIFIGFDNEQVDGLVYVCDITWGDNPDKELFNYKKGDRVKVKILNIDPTKEKISVGIKQVEYDPMEDALQNMNIEQTVECTISEEKDDFIVVTISKGVDGMIKTEDFGEKVPLAGVKIMTKVVEIDPDRRLILLTPIQHS